MSHSCVKTSSFHNIAQIASHSLSRSAPQSHELPVLSLILLLTPFFAVCSCHTFARSWPCSQQDTKVQGCLSCCKCQWNLVPPQGMGAETTTLIVVLRMPSHTASIFTALADLPAGCFGWVLVIFQLPLHCLLIQTAGEKNPLVLTST